MNIASILPSSEKEVLLIIDDEPDIRDCLRELLATHFSVTSAPNGYEGIKLVQQLSPAAVLLDINLPDVNGFGICETLKAHPKTATIPVLMFSGFNDTMNRTRSFTVGADDFIAKPFFIDELVARITSKIKKNNSVKPAKSLQFGDLFLDLVALQAKVNGKAIALSVLEFDLLYFLVSSPDRILSRKRILENVWRGCVVSPRTIDTHIAILRKKIPYLQNRLKTVYGAGYIVQQ